MDMKLIFKAITLLVILFGIVGCSAIELFESTKIKRYKSANFVEVDNEATPIVTMDLFGANISKKPTSSIKKGLWDLSNRGQVEYIKVLNGRNKTNTAFNKAIETQFNLNKPKGKTDYTEKSVKMVFSISKERRYHDMSADSNLGYSTADRIEYLKFKILIDSILPVRFNNWNKFETEYKTINLGDVSFNRTFSFSGGVGSSSTKSSSSETSEENVINASSTGSSYSPNVNATAASSNTENIKINNRFISLTGKLKNKVIEIEQEGNREIDLTGNVVVDVSLRFDPVKERIANFEELFKKETTKGKTKESSSKSTSVLPNDPTKVKLKFSTVKVPNKKELENIELALSYDFVYRHVKNLKGRKTEYEYDDRVVYYKDKSPNSNEKMVSILRPRDYMPKFTRIGFFEDKAKTNKVNGENEYSDIYHEFHFRNANRNIDAGVLAFTNETASYAFANWLVKSAQNLHEKIESTKKLTESSKSKRKLKEKMLLDLSKKLRNPIKIGDYELTYITDELPPKSINLEYIYKYRHLINTFYLYNFDKVD